MKLGSASWLMQSRSLDRGQGSKAVVQLLVDAVFLLDRGQGRSVLSSLSSNRGAAAPEDGHESLTGATVVQQPLAKGNEIRFI